jgi:hypothetical protein
LTKSAYEPREDDEPPSYLAGVPTAMFAGDVSHRLLISVRGVHDLVEKEALVPLVKIPKDRRGRTEYFLVFSVDSVERVAKLRERRRSRGREPRQLNFPFFAVIAGGKT